MTTVNLDQIRLINPNTIRDVRIISKEVHSGYRYFKEIKVFGITLIKERFYEFDVPHGRTIFDFSEITKNKKRYIENNTVYLKPHLQITTLDRVYFVFFENTSVILDYLMSPENPFKNYFKFDAGAVYDRVIDGLLIPKSENK